MSKRIHEELKHEVNATSSGHQLGRGPSTITLSSEEGRLEEFYCLHREAVALSAEHKFDCWLRRADLSSSAIQPVGPNRLLNLSEFVEPGVKYLN